MTFLLDHDVPDDITYSLLELGCHVIYLRNVLPITIDDREVLKYAIENRHILITCNRDDFLDLAQGVTHSGIIILIRRNNRISERTALVRLLDTAGESGIRGNINFA